MDKIENEKAAGGVETIAAAGDMQREHSTIHATHSGNSTSAQRGMLLARLRIAPIDTITARRDLDVMHPAARIMELKRRGYRIETVWIERPTDCGKVHRVALYILQPWSVPDE